MTIYDNIKAPETLFETSSEYNQNIKVIRVGETTKLEVDGTVQSVNHKSQQADSRVWGQVGDLIAEKQVTPTRILILGLGGATMQQLLAEKFPAAELVSVEIDAAIIDVAKKFFGAGEIPNHKIVEADACEFIVTPEKYGYHHQSFSTVIVDIFCGSEYPDLGKSGNFVAHITKMAAPGGLVIVNRLYHEDYQEEVDLFTEFVEGFLRNVDTKVVAGKTNSDHVLIYGTV